MGEKSRGRREGVLRREEPTNNMKSGRDWEGVEAKDKGNTY